jgi:hypothetical protein
VVCQVRTVDGARRAAAAGVDVVTAQGTKPGHTGRVSTLPLVPAVVDAVAPLPVVASGGIADGRGIAAALMLGADGVWIDTRFLRIRRHRGLADFPRSFVNAPAVLDGTALATPTAATAAPPALGNDADRWIPSCMSPQRESARRRLTASVPPHSTARTDRRDHGRAKSGTELAPIETIAFRKSSEPLRCEHSADGAVDSELFAG